MTGEGGGFINKGTISAGRDVNLHNQHVYLATPAPLDGALRPVRDAIEAAGPEVRPEAHAKLQQLQDEAAKGGNAHDGVIAKLVGGLAGLVPGATSAIVSAFATPILKQLSGQATRSILESLK